MYEWVGETAQYWKRKNVDDFNLCIDVGVCMISTLQMQIYKLYNFCRSTRFKCAHEWFSTWRVDIRICILYVGVVLFLENRYTLVVMLIVYDGELVVKSHLLLYYGGRQDTVRVARR